VAEREDEEALLRSAALQNARTILIARQRAESETHQAKEALRESAERLQLALSAGRLGDWSWNISDDTIVLGKRAAEIYGIPPGRPYTRTWMRGLLHKDDAARARDTLTRALAERTDYHIEYRVIHSTLGERWIAATGVATHGPDGKMTGMIGVVQDIHERKTAEEAVRESAGRLQLALSAGHLGDWTWEAAADRVVLGTRAADIFGLAPDEPVTRARIRELLHADDVEKARRAVDGALAARTLYSTEYRIMHPTRGERWIAARGLGSYAPDGTVLGMSGVFQDITERKNAEDALKETQSRLQMAVEAGQMGDWEWSIRTGKVIWSPALEAIHGLPPGGFGGGFEDFKRDIHPQDRARVLETIQRSVDDRSDYRVEYRIIKPDAGLTWIEARGKLQLDAQGNPERMAGICMDVTPRKQAEEKLRDESRILELLNRTGSVLAEKLDLQSLVQAVTDAATQLSGAKFGAFFYNTTDDKGDSYLLYTLCGAPREAFAKFGQPRATALFGPTFNGEAPIRSDDIRKDPRYGKWAPHHGMPPGHLPVCSYLGVPVTTRSGEVIGGLFFGHPEPGVFTERTERIIVGIAAQAAVAIDNARLYEAAQKAAEERKQLLENEQAARADAERANAMKDEFLATLSHELRTPLNSILGWSQVLKMGSNAADAQRGLDAIERNARVQAQLIEDLLDMSRITSGKVRLEIQPVEPIPILEAAIETVRPAAEVKHIRIDKLFDPAAGPVYGDPSRLQQIIWNLLSNAIKFTPKEGKVQIVLARVNSHIEISVADTGIGIKPEFLPFVFDRFRQADASTTRTFGGLGLGLAIVKHLVELHGGTVRVKSAGEGQGTTFVVHLPLTVVHRNGESGARVHPKTPQTAPDFKNSDLAGVRVLVVDDEADARELVKHVLAECDAEVFTAESADDALAIIERERPHVLVSDIGMPVVDGYELLKRVRALGPALGGSLPAVALTAFARSEDRTRALRAGFLVHVSKPVEPAELVATVASVSGRTGK
jgi:PAS domain S-box-containing protein